MPMGTDRNCRLPKTRTEHGTGVPCSVCVSVRPREMKAHARQGLKRQVSNGGRRTWVLRTHHEGLVREEAANTSGTLCYGVGRDRIGASGRSSIEEQVARFARS